MARYIAFLRAINVGGRTVKMERLRQLFVSLGFSGVETFIASGNVAFEASETDTASLERSIARELKRGLGFEVATFVRTDRDLARIAARKAFGQREVDAATSFNIVLLSRPLDKDGKQKVAALTTDSDRFAVHGREIYWLCRTKQSESTFSNAVLEKTLGRQSTIRGAATIKKLADKYSSRYSD